jgi:hypothetical protein
MIQENLSMSVISFLLPPSIALLFARYLPFFTQNVVVNFAFAIFYHLLIDEMCYISITRQHWKPKWKCKFKDDILSRVEMFLTWLMLVIIYGSWYFWFSRLDEGRSTHLWNVGLLHRDYTAVYVKRLSSSFCG